MGEANIEDVVRRLSDTRSSARKEALDELKFVLQQNKGTSRIDWLGDEGFHQIYEALFQSIRIERSAYISSSKTSKSSKSSNAANRLRDCAHVFRLAVDIGVRKIASKTANAVIDNVVETLPVTTDSYCDPLGDDYFKILRAILNHAAHVEHLRDKKWRTLTDFLLHGISHFASEDNSSSSGNNVNMLSQHSRNGRVTSFRVSQSSASHTTRYESGRPVEDLFFCLDRLTAATNAPIMLRAAAISECVISFLSSASAGGSLHQIAFSCVNNVMAKIITEDTKLAQKICLETIPIIRRFWSSKNILLRDEMLITLVLSSDIIKAVPNTKPDENVYSSLNNLLEVMSAEYSRRNERDLLQLDEILFSTDQTQQVMDLEKFRVRAENTRGTFNWATVGSISFLTLTVDQLSRVLQKSRTDDTPSKRRKLTSGVDDVFRQSLTASTLTKIRALQTVCFLLNDCAAVADKFLNFLVQYTNQILDEDPTTAAWTMIAISSVLSLQSALKPEMKAQWLQIWHLAARNLSNPNVSRPAAHLLNAILRSNVLQYTNISTLIDTTVFSDGLNGPVGISDAALSLWYTIIEYQSAGGQLAPQQTIVRFTNWLSTYYTLSLCRCPWVYSLIDWFAAPNIDRASSKQIALHATPRVVLELLLLCTNVEVHLHRVDRQVVSSSVFTVAFELSRNAGLSEYLIGGQVLQRPKVKTSSDVYEFKGENRAARDTSSDRGVLEMLLVKLQNFREAWIALAKERASNVSADIVQIMVSLIIVGAVMPRLLGIERSHTCKELKHSVHQAWALLSSFIQRPEDVGSVNAGVAAAAVTAIRYTKDLTVGDPVLESLSFMLLPLLTQLRHTTETPDGCEKDDLNMVDIGDPFASHSSQATSDQTLPYVNRKDLPFATERHYFQRDMMLQLRINLTAVEAASLSGQDALPEVLDIIIDLKPEDLLTSRSSLMMFLESSNLSNSDACRLLKKIAEACIQQYEFERCEASLCLCLEVLTVLAELWVNEGGDELHDVASDMYGWFISVPLGKSLASARVLICLAKLLQRVLNLNLTYNNASLPSSRTSLFEILRSGNNIVKFHVAKNITHIFERFVLTEHTAILHDVVESLPNDSTDLDGIALRLYVLAELAARWATLLRPSVYHLFETSAHIPLSVAYAQGCLHKITSTLGLESPRALFNLFAPQLLYTWLETESLESIPFSIYGFQTLTELITDVQDEAVGQIVMRANKDLAGRLSEIMKAPFDTMLEASFQRAEAYSVARDISMPPSKDNASKSTESQVRKQLGTDKYLRLVSLSFPQIVANLFMTLSDEHEMERALTKRSEFGLALTRLQSMYRLSASKIILPPGQQPSFRAKYLLDELEFLCQRIGKDLSKMWTSPLVVHVCRSLFDAVIPALGSLHACSMLRKIRILVALAGQEALEGYAMEMLLQSLQPYLTKFYCAEDALGIFWYLLDKGRDYLRRNLSFLCETGLTTILSLSVFLSSPQDSTTQESHYLSTLSITQSFHKWFVQFLTTFPDKTHAADDATIFKTIITYAGEARPPGRADKDSAEGNLLLQLFEARTSGQKMLSATAFERAVRILCKRFTRPAKPEEDILGQDSVAIRHAKVLYGLFGEIDVADEFWTWCAEALGRAYAANGKVDSTLMREQPQALFDPSRFGSASSRISRSLVVDQLSNLLRSDDYTAASLAEKTLQRVITHAAQQATLNDYEDCFDLGLMRALNWHPSPLPDMQISKMDTLTTDDHATLNTAISLANWASRFMVSLISAVEQDSLLGALPPILSKIPSLAIRVMPFVVHAVLAADNRHRKPHRQLVAQAFLDVLLDNSPSVANQRRLVLTTLLYLRCQPLRRETTIADRSSWLDIDLATAASAATSCALYKSALLLLELHASQQASQSSRTSRRSSLAKAKESPDLMRQIYQNLDDPDFFYGMQEEASLSSIIRKLSHEGDEVKNLSFQSALFDSDIKVHNNDDHSGLLRALVSANMNGVARAVQTQLTPDVGQRSVSLQNVSKTALNLHQWELPASSTASDPSTVLFQVLRTANISLNFTEIPRRLDGALLTLGRSIAQEHNIGNDLRQSMSALAVLTEIKEALCLRGSDELAAYWQKLEKREEWHETENFGNISLILAGREAFFSTVKKQNYLTAMMRLDLVDCHIFEVKCIRHSLKLARSHAALQPALNRAMYLSILVNESAALGLAIGDVALHDFAGVLWDQGDMMGAIQMLKQLKGNPEGSKQAIIVSRPALLADMGHRIADARLERPDEIINNYLLPAIKDLRGKGEGKEAGRVYHEFAFFCDQQLQSADGLDEFSRVQKIREQKEAEVKDLERMVDKAQSKQREQLTVHYAKAKQWYKLDDAEYQRLKRTRESLLQQSLENYLLSLRACDDYVNDVLRFCAMWLDNSGNPATDVAVGKYLAEVASRKFVPLMNQLSSRLLDSHDEFQEQLFDLLLRICTEHPFHGMYQIFASSKSKGGKDDLALSRHAAANRLSEELRKGPASNIWVAIHNSNISFIRFALDHLPDGKGHRSGSKVPLAEIPSGQKLVQEILNLTTKIPPPTLKIPIRLDCDYGSVPVLKQFEPEFSVAGGISVPKVITILASDGSRMKALLKGGNDDLRQDSIMEQVFEQVSNLLGDHRETRQRQLGIRTYKVLPLTMNAGIIEFVSNTIPLHDYSLPAHQKYFPNDWKATKCRTEVGSAQSRSLSTRIQVFRTVCTNFQPVLRHFFFERFLNPDDWFTKRLAYSRSTAAISILGHVLGLGDRHGHNILLDEQTGEVVHIDLGVAFEAGRVLPVPEVVPFRLTRDIVDGMGLSGVEGVFRRCCNFTLEALRQDQYSIMTILDVLRYDPLYSWSISPLRLQRMQEKTEAPEGEQRADGAGEGMTALANKKAVNNPSEADRALTVVSRKLGKTLSVEASVNELIQQAVDERNLAVLWGGWAAYA